MNAAKDLNALIKELSAKARPEDITAFLNKTIALLECLYGKNNPHSQHIRSLSFIPQGTITYTGQSLAEEAWANGKNAYIQYIQALIEEQKYKMKYPEPLVFTEKVTLQWLRKNVPASLWFFSISLLFSTFMLGVTYGPQAKAMWSKLSTPESSEQEKKTGIESEK